jgi:hypothetical protein
MSFPCEDGVGLRATGVRWMVDTPATALQNPGSRVGAEAVGEQSAA